MLHKIHHRKKAAEPARWPPRGPSLTAIFLLPWHRRQSMQQSCVFTASGRMHTLASSHAAWQRARVWAELMMYRLGFHACVLQATPLSICLYDGHPQTPMLPICQFLLLIMNSDWRIKPRVSSDLSKRKKTTQLFLTDGTTLHFYLGIAIVCSSIICATHTRFFSSTSVYTMCDFLNDT